MSRSIFRLPKKLRSSNQQSLCERPDGEKYQSHAEKNEHQVEGTSQARKRMRLLVAMVVSVVITM